MSSWEMEYTALRGELLKRIELRQHILLATLTIAAVFLGFGVKEGKGLVTLVYPIIAIFLYIAWAQSDSRIGDLGDYIRERYENARPNIKYLKWENHMVEIRGGRGGKRAGLRYVALSGVGVFWSTQAIAILVGILDHPWESECVLFVILLILAALCFMFSVILHATRSRRKGEEQHFRRSWHRLFASLCAKIRKRHYQ